MHNIILSQPLTIAAAEGALGWGILKIGEYFMFTHIAVPHQKHL